MGGQPGRSMTPSGNKKMSASSVNMQYLPMIELRLRLRVTASTSGATLGLLGTASLLTMVKSSQLWAKIMMTMTNTTVPRTSEELGGSKRESLC